MSVELQGLISLISEVSVRADVPQFVKDALFQDQRFKAAIAAVAVMPAQPEGNVPGWKLVPETLTEDMRCSLAASYTLYRHAATLESREVQITNLWSDVLSIAPASPGRAT